MKLKRRKAGEANSGPRGFVLVQIDALSWAALLEGIRRRRAPFLGRLIGRHGGVSSYGISRLRPGVPATTPKVQAEVLYGSKQRIPGFRFLRRASGRTIYFGNAFDVARLEENQFAGRFGILQNSGSSYFNIFTGAADTSRFSSSAVGSGTLWNSSRLRLWNAINLIWIGLLMLPRLAWRIPRELILESFDIWRSFLKHERNRGRFSFVVRSLTNIVQGEITVAATREDIARGTQHLFINFLGYDKAAHLRGVDHPYALWSLKLIDNDIRRLFRMARRSSACRYDFFVMSDHGMAPARPIELDAGCNFETLLNEQLAKAGYIGAPLIVRATGNLAHIYFDASPTSLNYQDMLERIPHFESVLESSKYVGWWAMRTHDGQIRIVRDGQVHVVQPGDAPTERIDAELVRDLDHLLRLVDSGDLVLFGAREAGLVWNFLDEYGCHGGDEPEEQDAFVLHPEGFNPEQRRLAPIDLFRFFRDEYHR